MKIQANGILMNYELSGASGRVMTLIHGSGDNLEAWWPQVSAFLPKYRVLRYDIRGHGQTETPEGDIDPKVWVADLYELLRTLGVQKTYLLGYSMGAGIAVSFATAHRDMADAIIMANGGVPGLIQPSEEQQKDMEQRRAAQIELLQSKGMAGLVDERIKMIFSPGFPEKNPATVERYRALFLQNDPANYIKVIEAAPKQTTPTLQRIMGKSALPTLIIAGENDPWSGPEAAKKTMETLKGAELRVMPTGHASNLEAPEEFNKTILAFLEDAEFLAESVSLQGGW